MNEKISNGEIYRMVVKIDTRLESMESSMNGRISSLELWRAEVMGRIAVFVAVISIAITFAVDFLKQKMTGR